MNDSPLDKLRFHGTTPGCDTDSEASCSSGVYVSNEEASLIQTLLALREEADAIRATLGAETVENREELKRRLEELRREWKTLAARRDRAGTRKMAMLGHIPWHEAQWDE